MIWIGNMGLCSGIYCPGCGCDLTGERPYIDERGAEVACTFCDDSYDAAELLDDRTTGQAAAWRTIYSLSLRLDEARARLAESRRQVDLLREAAVASRMPEEVSRG
jgi:hypothetical protein